MSQDRLIFDRQEDSRAKTGRAALGTVSPRTERLISEYLGAAQRLPDVMLFRMRTGSEHGEPRRGFATIRELVFPGDKRRLMDMRHPGTVEAIAGGADAVGLSAKLANSIGRSNALHKTCAPVDIEAKRNTDEAKLRGRRKMRGSNESGAKVSTLHPGEVSTERAKRS